MKAFLLFSSVVLTSASLSTEPCEVITNAKGSETAYSFKCRVESKQNDGIMYATFSRPFELTTSSGIALSDTRPDVGQHFTYYFNPLGSLGAGSSILADKGCGKTGDGGKNVWDAGAYQWDDRLKEKGCTRLTGEAKGGASTNSFNGWSAFLLDKEDASMGIMLHMSGGDKCDNVGRPRKFNISLTCGTSVDVQSKDFLEEFVSEDETCTYEIDLETTHGCPDECTAPFNVFKDGIEPGSGVAASKHVCNSKGACRSLADGRPSCGCTKGDAGTTDPNYVGPGCSYACPNEFEKPCNNQGHCGFEPDLLVSKTYGKAKCFCNAGYEGEMCETKNDNGGGVTPENSTTAPASPLPWIFVLFASAGLGGVWFLHRKEHGEPFCCCGNGGHGDGFGSTDGPPAFSALEGGNGSYVAPGAI